MSGFLLLTYGATGGDLLAAATHVLGTAPGGVEIIAVADTPQTVDELPQRIAAALYKLRDQDSVLILVDLPGSTHCNIASRHLAHGRVGLLTGLNLPMLLRLLGNRDLALDELLERGAQGGIQGITASPGGAG